MMNSTINSRQSITIPISESDLDMFKALIYANSKSLPEPIQWTFPDSNGNLVDIEFVKED